MNGFESLIYDLRHHGHVTNVTVKFPGVDIDFSALSSALAVSTSVEHLVLECFEHRSNLHCQLLEKDAPLLASVLSNHPSIHSLTIDFESMDAEAFKIVLTALKHNKVLRNIGFYAKHVASDDMRLLTQIVRYGGLTSMTFWSASLGDDGLRVLAELLGESENLCRLLIDGDVFTDISPLAKSLKNNRGLKTLRMGTCRIDHLGAASLANMLSENVCLEKLLISSNPIGRLGATALAKSLHRNETLHSLQISHCGITGSGAAFFTALGRNFTLHGLTTSELNSNVMDAIWERLGRNGELAKWDDIEERIANVFIGLHCAFGNDVYTHLLVVDSFPFYNAINRQRKVFFLQALVQEIRF